ncbi:hypothetical protein HGRIS_014816 [Hohenbuehelia grisea]|uniref:Dipeptidyl aminopeptidase n=1 Tax=Hohenbuehelia grisea TaxID=104357 RepID=A0ABR3IQU5_9AGAR
MDGLVLSMDLSKRNLLVFALDNVAQCWAQSRLCDNASLGTEPSLCRPPTCERTFPHPCALKVVGALAAIVVRVMLAMMVLRKRPASIQLLVASVVTLVALTAIVGLAVGITYNGAIITRHEGAAIVGIVARDASSAQALETKKISIDDVFNGTLRAESASINWIPQAGDGVFVVTKGSTVQLVDLKTNDTKVLFDQKSIKDEDGNPLEMNSWQLSADMKYILFRESSNASQLHILGRSGLLISNYYVASLETLVGHAIIPPSHPPTTWYAKWSPTGASIAFVNARDLYILPSPDQTSHTIRVTSSGNDTIFNGLPDWVYEEEVSKDALWWSPDSGRVAFLSFNDASVEDYKFPIFNPTEDSHTVVPYPSEYALKYPKPGYDNPLVSAHVFDIQMYLEASKASNDSLPATSTLDLDWPGRLGSNESIIQEVAWTSNTTLIVKEVSRNADAGSAVLFDVNAENAAKGTIVRKLGKDGEEGDDGWIDSAQSITAVPSVGPGAYLDIVPTKDGFNHIALFNSANANSAQFLTSGSWEVTRGLLKVDHQRALVYFTAARPSSMVQHVYSIPLPKDENGSQTPSGEPTPLTNETEPAYYTANVSPQGGFYSLSYGGPGTPWAKIVKVDEKDFEYVITKNDKLVSTLSTYERGAVIYGTIEVDGHDLDYQEIRPPNMDESGQTKYPVLFKVYGGPDSRSVSVRYGVDWSSYLAWTLGYIVVIVDGRGTGLKGRKFRNPVKDKLGYWETMDQVEAARVWASKEYVDAKKIGIWGWSYGGYMSAKVVEANAGVHSLAMAVAPVTNWRLYDTIYTERYMNLPQLNEVGYANSSVTDMTGFHKADFLLAHGSADDNVHFAHSAHLLDMLTQAKVRKYSFRMFVDSDHSIARRGANREIYEYLTQFLVEKWGASAEFSAGS